MKYFDSPFAEPPFFELVIEKILLLTRERVLYISILLSLFPAPFLTTILARAPTCQTQFLGPTGMVSNSTTICAPMVWHQIQDLSPSRSEPQLNWLLAFHVEIRNF